MALRYAFVTAAAALCRMRLLQRLLFGAVIYSTNLFSCDRTMFSPNFPENDFTQDEKTKLVEYVSYNVCLKDKMHVRDAYKTLCFWLLSFTV